MQPLAPKRPATLRLCSFLFGVIMTHARYGFKTVVHFELMARCDVLKTTGPYGELAACVHGYGLGIDLPDEASLS